LYKEKFGIEKGVGVYYNCYNFVFSIRLYKELTMTTVPVFRFGVIKFLLFILGFLFMGAGFSFAGEPNGLIKIEGRHIKRLVLIRQSENYKKETFLEPNESIRIPLGQYQISEIELRGGYTSYQYNLPKNIGEITVKEGESSVVKLGAPLTQSVKIERRGNSLQLSCKLQGIGGEDYSEQQRNNAPRFAVYKGDVQIGSGTFAYG
jgi:hypothetical protein